MGGKLTALIENIRVDDESTIVAAVSHLHACKPDIVQILGVYQTEHFTVVDFKSSSLILDIDAGEATFPRKP